MFIFIFLLFFISSLALCKLVEHTVSTNDQRLQSIEVQGEQIFNPAEGIKTRSKSAQGTSIQNSCVILFAIIDTNRYVFQI